MPQELKIGPYSVFFWSNENDLLEPVHVHITEGTGNNLLNCTEHTLLCHNNSEIPDRILKRLLRIIEANSQKIINDWLTHFGEIRYYC